MEYCIKCGAKLPEKAEFCTKCGTPIKSSDETKKEIKEKKSMEEKIDETAEDIGKKVDQIGKKIEKKAYGFGDYINQWYEKTFKIAGQWYDKTFKIAGPLIGAFIAIIILRIIIYIILTVGKDNLIATALGEGLHEYFLIIFALMLLSGYNTYFYRKYKPQYQWVYPFISTIGFIIGAWIAAQIMLIISQTNDTPIIEAIGTFINTYLIGIFILVLIISYVALFASGLYTSQEKK